MHTLSRLLIVVMLSGCAGEGGTVQKEKPKELEMVSIGASHFVIREDFKLHAITHGEWARRSELGIPEDARKCGGPYYLYFKKSGGEKGVVIGIATEDKHRKLTAIEPRMYFSDTAIEKPRLFFGSFVRYGQLSPLGNYLFVPPLQFSELVACATRDEMHT